MAKRDLSWKKTGETNILRTESEQGEATDLQRGQPEAAQRKGRVKHRLTVDIYEDQFMAMEIRKATRVAGTVTDQIREALDLYLAEVPDKAP